MRYRPKNIYARNCNVSEQAFKLIVYYWWGAHTAIETRDLIAKELAEEFKTEKEKKRQYPVSRETISKLFGEIGKRFWLTAICHYKVVELVENGNRNGSEVLISIFEDQHLYYNLIKTEVEPRKIQIHRKNLGHSWSVFSDRPIMHLWGWFKRCNGFSRQKFDGYTARAILIENYLQKSSDPFEAVKAATNDTLDVLVDLPLRTALPSSLYPWVSAWEALNREAFGKEWRHY